ncbi:hypothetical protein CC85DRAFT_129292 [Cutaneotrichosporon oleaginosum]|uniref:Uncharacterized protein n=1 Tax=Cutaneotrichosporon oleaginosum TaxID=879819 RepID=A0A0J0XJ87_9TREE|nr:uncharacterized protein CC85DRAFT_129292 [Cutaneotrichosporon oleaginosum]KLT41126.1 hypothetical protein CC85DRAFT_129292 [Cutaneotrichosporon oleaginosum]TXT05742.1 hypothetical protein COLE_07062 [Cutaneotrichosporon oleaginosum]
MQDCRIAGMQECRIAIAGSADPMVGSHGRDWASHARSAGCGCSCGSGSGCGSGSRLWLTALAHGSVWLALALARSGVAAPRSGRSEECRDAMAGWQAGMPCMPDGLVVWRSGGLAVWLSESGLCLLGTASATRVSRRRRSQAQVAGRRSPARTSHVALAQADA